MDTIKKILLILTAIIYLWIGFSTVIQVHCINFNCPIGENGKVFTVERKIIKKISVHYKRYLPLTKNIGIEKLFPVLRTDLATDPGIERYAAYFIVQNNRINTFLQNLHKNKAPPFYC